MDLTVIKNIRALYRDVKAIYEQYNSQKKLIGYLVISSNYLDVIMNHPSALDEIEYNLKVRIEGFPHEPNKDPEGRLKCIYRT